MDPADALAIYIGLKDQTHLSDDQQAAVKAAREVIYHRAITCAAWWAGMNRAQNETSK